MYNGELTWTFTEVGWIMSQVEVNANSVIADFLGRDFNFKDNVYWMLALAHVHNKKGAG